MVPEAQTFSPAPGVQLGYRALPSPPNPSLPTLLMIHPFITDGSFYAPQFEDPQLGGQAGKKWNMIAIDIHGHGDSTGRKEFNYWDTAFDTALLLDHLGIKNVTIVGTSQGGFVATRLAIHRPDLVKDIIYAGSSVLLETKNSYDGIIFFTNNFPYVEDNLGIVVQGGFGFDHTAANATKEQKAAAEKWLNVWKTRYGGSPENEERALGCTKQLLGRDDIIPRLKELKTKIHIMHGENDSIYTVAEHAEGSKKVLEEHDLLASYTIVPGGAHYLSFEKWQEINPRLIQIMTEA
ncbi:Alpha/Beta hydrolase protein [Pyronema omphalodes]|nr:Alpha/Beta hydrolase protein [Pyronema omphalodes]